MHLWKRAWTLAALALAVVASLPARAQVPEIEQFLETALPQSGAPGVAYAVVEQGAIRSGARGEALKGSGREVTPDTPFLLGSISKSFTALGIMQLVEAGEVELDAPASRYLGEYSDRPSGAVTIRQLLTHTSGYSTNQGNRRHVDAEGDSSEVERDLEEGPSFAPGTMFDYSNANYRILGRVIEAVSGSDYPTFIETRILQPLGMESSFVSDGETYPQMAVGHRPWFLTKRPWEPGRTHRVNAPAGGIVASANDVALYLAMMMNGEDDILSAEGKTAMMRASSEAAPGYGFGWNLVNGGETVYHTGTTPGVETQATLIPEEGIAAVVLVNAGSGMGFGETGALIGGVTARALGYEHQPASGSLLRQSMMALVVLSPVLFVICILWAWKHREVLRAKSGVAGSFSLWFPLVMTLVLAWSLLWLVPYLFGTSFTTLHLYLPDMVIAMIASSVTGVTWAVLRLAIAFGGKRGGA
ncbi:serine hydrolase domain-containing protein [Alteraurantiacibacter aquimixticola]|uniref:Class A beta-lactamase-related serine hydrolase n=1 Tax=Alteraurantiacibacter aquimixticola TaxID=2489173 RepID=A0A4T3F1T3_9SPHN|nr:serine hydrolase domain-containing protein [Alteraurantiacibacter aquimixticola]TIX50527.1 class A beta-lactamase-related serine hydrolase [Alteraurantiacibacter aquimixticola]